MMINRKIIAVGDVFYWNQEMAFYRVRTCNSQWFYTDKLSAAWHASSTRFYGWANRAINNYARAQTVWPSARQFEDLVALGHVTHEQFTRAIMEGKVADLGQLTLRLAA